MYTWIYIYIYMELNLGTDLKISKSLPGRVDTAVSHAAVGDRSKLHIRHAAQQMEGRLPAFLARSTRSDRLNAGDEFCLEMNYSLDWFKGKSTGNHGFYHQI